jgi:hypothetical protein
VRSWYPWFLVASLTSLEAAALDKQGSAHGGSVTGADSGFNVSGAASLGVSLFNPSYAARPDNTGLALMRYGVHGEVSLWGDLISFAVDTTLFSDRQRRGMGKLAPSELDVTPEIIGRIAPWELHLAYERDLPLDRSGLVQSFVYALLVYSFDMQQSTPAPLGLRNQIPSP